MKRQVQSFLKNVGLYDRLRASRIYDFYWSFADPHWLADRSKEVEFYKETLFGLKKGSLIFDIGANDGFKTDIFLRLGARVVAVEPDATNLEILKGKFLRKRIFPAAVKIEGKAVSDEAGEMTMWIHEPGSAVNTLNWKWANTLRRDNVHVGQKINFESRKTVRTTTLEELIEKHGAPFYIKVDVEGHEVNVLRGLQRPVPYISFEVNLPEFRTEGVECIFMLGDLDPKGEFNYVSDCRDGMVLKNWASARDFLSVFERCQGPMIEVFWRTREIFG